MSVSHYGDISADEALPAVDPIESSADNPQFLIQDMTDEDWVDPRVQTLCRDDAGQIAGGASEYPSVIPAAGSSCSPTSV